MAITRSDRNAFIGGHVTQKAKSELEREAMKRNITVSALLAEAVDLLLKTSRQADTTSPKRPE
jgi:hypothetical protein